jgi:hypothetical protein
LGKLEGDDLQPLKNGGGRLIEAVRSCQQNPSHLRRVEDEIQTQLVMVFVIWI